MQSLSQISSGNHKQWWYQSYYLEATWWISFGPFFWWPFAAELSRLRRTCFSAFRSLRRGNILIGKQPHVTLLLRFYRGLVNSFLVGFWSNNHIWRSPWQIWIFCDLNLRICGELYFYSEATSNYLAVVYSLESSGPFHLLIWLADVSHRWP